MLISKKHDFLFIHNPKAGGSAIRSALAPYCESPFKYWHQKFLHTMPRVVDYAHMDRFERDADSIPGSESFRFAFMIVRDPIERFLSGFAEHCRQHNRKREVNDFIEREMTYGNLHHDWKYVHMRPQWTFMDPRSMHIFKHEDLKDTWEGISMAAIGRVVPLTVTRPDTGMKPTLESLRFISLQRLCTVYAHDYRLFRSLYAPPVTPRQGGTHCENINFIHDPVLNPYLDTKLLNEGERRGHLNLLEKRKVHGTPDYLYSYVWPRRGSEGPGSIEG